MTKKPHFKAMLTYNPTEDGGIATPISSGFRSAVRFPFNNQDFIAHQTFLDTDLVFPGDTVSADIILIDPKGALKNIYNGLNFDLLLNSSIIGSGVITQLYFSDNS